MNVYLAQNLALDHIRESRQQAAAARKANSARAAHRRAGAHARRASLRIPRSV
jgi:hypothetical protein